VDDAHAPDGLLERCADVRVELVQSGRQNLCRHPKLPGPNPVEPLPQVSQGLCPTVANVVTDRSNRRQRGLDVELGPWQNLSKRARIEGTTTKVNP